MQHCRSSLISEQHVEIQDRGHTGIGGMAPWFQNPQASHGGPIVISGDEMASAAKGESVWSAWGFRWRPAWLMRAQCEGTFGT